MGKPFGPPFDWIRGKSSEFLKLNMIKRGNEEETTGLMSSIEQLMTFHFPKDGQDNSEQIAIRNEAPELSDDDPKVSQKELDAVFRSANQGKASGLDIILMEVVKMLYRANKSMFIGVMNKCLREGVFSASWKKANLFNKVDKDSSDASSYRPICLLPAWSKVLDKLENNMLVFYAQSQGFTHKNQFGFPPGKRIEHAIHELRRTTGGCHSRDNDRCVIMLDVKGTFNNLCLRFIVN